MRLLLSLLISIALTQEAALAYEPDPPINLSSMTSQYNTGHYPMAHYIGCQLLIREPSNLAVHYLLGNCYVKFGQLEKAATEYKFCIRTGLACEIGRFAQQALDQIGAIQYPAHEPLGKATIPSDSSAGLSGGQLPGPSARPVASASDATTAAASPGKTKTPLDKIDLETLEYKERLLKTGADKIATNKVKLQKQIETIQNETNLAIHEVPEQIRGLHGRLVPNPDYATNAERLLNDSAARIKQLQEANESEEQKITTYYQAQVDSISAQKASLTSQARVGHGDVRLVQKGSGLFVRNYVNYHGEVPLPPPPPELRATALKLAPSIPATKKSNP